MFEGNGFLNLIILGSDPWVVDIAVGVESCESLEPFVWAVVVDEPTKTKMIGLQAESNQSNQGFYIPRTFGEDENQSGCEK